MTTATGSGLRRDFDWALSLFSLAGALCCVWLLDGDRAGAQPHSELPPVAKLTFSQAEVRRRPVGTLTWNQLGVGSAVFELDSIFVPPGSGAALTFEDGSQLEVEENSLVVIQRPAAAEGEANQVQLVRGSASGVSGTRGMELRGTDWVTTLPARAGAKVNVEPGKEPRVEVFAGTALVKTRSGAQPLEQNHAAQIRADGALETARFPIALTAPARGARYWFQQTPAPIDFTWAQGGEQGLTLELAQDREFTQLALSTAAGEGSARFEPREAGTFWWRLVDAQRLPRSELRRLDVLHDVAPILSSPAKDEQIDTVARVVPLAWSQVQNAPAYRVELSKQEDFSTLALSARTTSNQLTVRDVLPEGPYHWRVRTEDPERGESPFSEARTFILIDRPLPDAPELIDSALEVTGGKKKR